MFKSIYMSISNYETLCRAGSVTGAVVFTNKDIMCPGNHYVQFVVQDSDIHPLAVKKMVVEEDKELPKLLHDKD